MAQMHLFRISQNFNVIHGYTDYKQFLVYIIVIQVKVNAKCSLNLCNIILSRTKTQKTSENNK